MKKYVVIIEVENKPMYFEYEQMGIIDPKTNKTIKEPQGFFVEDLNKARKFDNRFFAEAIASAYQGSKVEAIVEA